MSIVTTKDDFHVGQKVVVHKPHYRKDTSDRFDGEIVKISRRYLTVEIVRPGVERCEVEDFDIATRKQRVRGDYANYLWWFATPETQALVDREARAREVWREHRLRSEFSNDRFTLDQVEAIAQVLDPTWIPGPQDPS